MKVAGVDLAGKPENETGFCIFEEKKNQKYVQTDLLHSDDEILSRIGEEVPSLVAIDAPLTYTGQRRDCDDELMEYGALPVTLKGMQVLAERGRELGERLREENFNPIEVYSTASAKILGFYDKDEKRMQKNLLSSGLKGDLEKKFLTKDELDAIFAAITAFLHEHGSTRIVRGGGEVVVPKV